MSPFSTQLYVVIALLKYSISLSIAATFHNYPNFWELDTKIEKLLIKKIMTQNFITISFKGD
jgi:hypothetical protein